MASPFTQPPPSDTGPSPTVRSILSLLLFVHFFCVFTVLGSTYLRSRLQSRLVAIFAPYTELLDFDPGLYTPFYYTQARTRDDDAVIEVDLYPDADRLVKRQELMRTVALPDGGSRWLGDRRRAIDLARRLALFTDPDTEADELSAEIARGVGGRLMRENNARGALVRCIRRLSQPLDVSTLFSTFPPNDPTAAPYNTVVYEADVWIDEDNEVQAQRRQAAAEVAPRRTAPPAGQRGQGAGTRSQGSGVKSQGSGVGGQESGKGSATPGRATPPPPMDLAKPPTP